MGVDQSTERLAVGPGGGHVVDVDPGVGVEEETAPLLQGLTSRQSHPRTSLLARLSSLSSLSPFAGCKNSPYYLAWKPVPVETRQSKYFQFKSEIFGKVVKFAFVADGGL